MDVQNQESRSSSWWFIIHTKLYRYKALLRKYWWLVTAAIALGLCVAAWDLARREVVYVSLGRIIVSGKPVLPNGAGFSEEYTNYTGTQIQLLLSSQIRQRAEARLQALEPGIQGFLVKIEALQAPQASIFNLRATGPTPDFTRKILDAVMQEYIATKREMRSEKSEATQTAITDQVTRLEKEVREGEEEIIDFQKRHNVGFLQEEGNSAGSYLVTLNRQLAVLKTESQLLQLLDLDQNLDRQQKNQTAENPAATDDQGRMPLASYGPENEYIRAKQQIEILKAQRVDFSRELRPKHPIIIELDQQISQQEALITTFRQQSIEQLKTRRESIQLQIQNLDGVVKEWETKALSLSAKLAEYNSIKSRLDRKKSALDRALNDFNTIEVSRNVDQDIVSIMEKASPPFPVKPGVLITLLMGLIGGAGIGLAVLFVVDQLDDRVASFVEFQTRFTERVLAQIPREKEGDEVTPLRANDDRHAFAEALRSLRSSIIFMPFEGVAPKTFLITSAVPNEGKSTIATNFALTLALADSRVLLIDGDLRRGTLHEQFGLSNARGFSDVLREEKSLFETVQATPVFNLFLLSRGTIVSNPGELYLSKAADRFLKDIYEDYDYIVIDSSPVMAADDTTSLAPKIDTTLFVFRFTHSSSRVSRKAIDLLRDRQANVLGVICNDVDEAMQEYHYYRYPEYYGTAGGALPATNPGGKNAG